MTHKFTINNNPGDLWLGDRATINSLWQMTLGDAPLRLAFSLAFDQVFFLEPTFGYN